MSNDNDWKDFSTHLHQLTADQIEVKLALEQFTHPTERALARLELKRREEDSELSRLRQELAECRRHLHNANIARSAAIASACAAVSIMALIVAMILYSG